MSSGSATDSRSAYVEGLNMLARRELSAAECRVRLARKEYPADEIDAAIIRLAEAGALDDRRVARAYARTSLNIRGRGRLRIQRELQHKGIDGDVVSEALDEVFGDTDERAMVARAIRKRLRDRTVLKDRAESARLFQYLMRLGYSSTAIVAELRRLTSKAAAEDDGE